MSLFLSGVIPLSPMESPMASSMKQTNTIRERKLRSRGRARKHAIENKGSTPTKAELFKVQG